MKKNLLYEEEHNNINNNSNIKNNRLIQNKPNIKSIKEVNDSYSCSFLDNIFTSFKSIDNIFYLIYSNKSKSIVSYNIIDNKKINEIKNAHNNYITNFRSFFDKNNKRDLIISISDKDNNIKLWNANNWTCLLNITNVNKEGYLNSACFLNDEFYNLYIVTSNFYYVSSESIKVYDLNGKKIKEINESNEKVIFIESYYDDNYSKSYIIISNHEYVKSYDYNNNALYHKYNDYIKRLHFSLIIKKYEEVIKLIESCYDGNLRIWNFHSGDLLQKIKVGVGGLQSICFNNNGDLIVSNNKNIKMINLNNEFITDLIKTNKNIISVKIICFQYDEYIIFQGQENNQISIYNINIS